MFRCETQVKQLTEHSLLQPLPTTPIGFAAPKNAPKDLLEFPLVKTGSTPCDSPKFSEWELSSAGRAADS